MLEHQAHSRNRPAATDEKKKRLVSYILVVISRVGTIGATENARHENAAPICKGGKCGKS